MDYGLEEDKNGIWGDYKEVTVGFDKEDNERGQIVVVFIIIQQLNLKGFGDNVGVVWVESRRYRG